MFVSNSRNITENLILKEKHMKTLRILSALLLIASVLLVPVSAATEFVPSIEDKGLDLVDREFDEEGYGIVCDVETVNGTLVVKLSRKTTTITNFSEMDKASEEIQEALKEAAEQLKSTPLDELVPGFAEAWAELTGGGPVINAVVTHLFDISTDYEILEGNKLHFNLKEHDVHPDTYVMLLHFVDGKWEIVPCYQKEDGYIEFWVDGLSPFALVIDNEGAPVGDADAPQSPATEESAFPFAPVAAAVVLFGFGCFCFVKASKRTAK